MKIGIVGLWHLGEVFSGCLAALGHQIIGIDEDPTVVAMLKRGIAPLAEPKLNPILKKNIKQGNLTFTTDFKSLATCDTLWITIDTPIDAKGRADTSIIFAYLKKSLPLLKNGVLIIISSQLPVGSAGQIIDVLKKHRKNFSFEYVYIPENLRLGAAVESFLKPSRVVIGIDTDKRKNEVIGIFKKLKTNRD